MRLFTRHLLTAEVYLDNTAFYRFRIKARNGEVILPSEGYTRHASALRALQVLKNHGLRFKIKDLTR